MSDCNRRWWPFNAYLSGLIALGLSSALLYARGITARYPLAIGLQSPRAGWSTLVGNSLLVGCVYAGVYGLLIAGYVLALRLVLRLNHRDTPLTIAIVIAGWLLSSAALLGAYPGESFDIFDYVFRGRMIVEYGASPLATAPVAFMNQPFYAYITWRGQVDTYGPLWEYASGAVAWVVSHGFGRGDSHTAYIIGYRLMAILLAGVCGLLIALMVRRDDPARAGAALLAWLWNPLLIVTSAIGAHNDLLMMLMVLSALLLFQRRRWIWGLLALVLAAHVKLTALLILPIIGLWLLRRRGWYHTLRDGAVALVLAIPLSWLLYAPLGGWFTLRRMLQERARLLVNSPADLAYRLLQERYGWAEAAAWRATTLGATAVSLVAAAAVLAWFWWNTRHTTNAAPPKLEILSEKPRESHAKPQSRQENRISSANCTIFANFAALREPFQTASEDALLWHGCIILTLLYLLIGSFWFQHWYLLWLLAPAALLPASRWTVTLLPAYCLGALWSNLTNSFLRYLPAHRLSATQVSAINVLAQVAPLLCVLVVTRIWSDAPRLLAQLDLKTTRALRSGHTDTNTW
jgi:Glycosyltransferase family 87